MKGALVLYLVAPNSRQNLDIRAKQIQTSGKGSNVNVGGAKLMLIQFKARRIIGGNLNLKLQLCKDT